MLLCCKNNHIRNVDAIEQNALSRQVSGLSGGGGNGGGGDGDGGDGGGDSGAP